MKLIASSRDNYTINAIQTFYIRGGQPFAHHEPIFSNVSRDAPYRRTFLVTMLLQNISDLPVNIIKYRRKIW